MTIKNQTYLFDEIFLKYIPYFEIWRIIYYSNEWL